MSKCNTLFLLKSYPHLLFNLSFNVSTVANSQSTAANVLKRPVCKNPSVNPPHPANRSNHIKLHKTNILKVD